MSADRSTAPARAPWPKCTRCGLEAPDVRGEPKACPDQKRCERVKQLPRPQLELYPVWIRPTLVDQRPWEELELDRVLAA